MELLQRARAPPETLGGCRLDGTPGPNPCSTSLGTCRQCEHNYAVPEAKFCHNCGTRRAVVQEEGDWPAPAPQAIEEGPTHTLKAVAHAVKLRHLKLKGFQSASRSSRSSCSLVKALADKEDAGKLIESMGSQLMPVQYFPRAAAFKDEVLGELDDYVWPRQQGDMGEMDDYVPQSTGMSGSTISPELPTAQAYLLANFIMLPCEVAEEVMDGIVENMVVFEKSKPSDEPVALQSRFPNALAPLFIVRMPELLKYCVYRREKQQVKFAMLIDDWLDTSMVFEITIRHEESAESANHENPACIPEKATHFVHILSKLGEDTCGGFLYLMEEYDKVKRRKVLKPVGVNAMTYSQQPSAFRFGGKKKLDPKDAEKWFEHSHCVGPHFAAFGATRYTFIGAGLQLDSTPLDHGAFVYWFDHADDNCYFPLMSAEKVTGNAGCSTRLCTAMLPVEGATSDRVKESLTAQIRTRSCCPCRKEPDVGQSVQIARLKVPMVLHPVVLWSLAYTTRTEVRMTMAAKVIAIEAHRKYVGCIVLSIIKLAINLAAIYLVASSTRGLRESWWATGAGIVMFLCLVWESLRLYMVHRAQSCWALIGFRRANVFWLVKLLLDCLTVSAIYVCHGLGSTEWAEWVLRVLLSMAAIYSWVSMLMELSNFSYFHLGQQILPILYALNSVKKFILITLCGMSMFMMAGYALSDDDIWLIWQRTFNLAFLQDFEFEVEDVKGKKEGQADFITNWTGLGSKWQYLFFIGSTLILAVALTNIFIGLMSNAFDHYMDRANELFVQQRANTALKWALFFQGARQVLGDSFGKPDARGQLLWFSHVADVHVDGDGSDGGVSLRSLLRASSRQLEKNVVGKISKVDAKFTRKFAKVDRTFEKVQAQVASHNDTQKQLVEKLTTVVQSLERLEKVDVLLEHLADLAAGKPKRRKPLLQASGGTGGGGSAGAFATSTD